MFKERPFSLASVESEVLAPYDYYCLIAPNEWRIINSVPLRRMLLEHPSNVRNSIMSLRLSTGIMGELDCPSGDSDHAPKGVQEVIIGLGHAGIKALLDLGALPCISCHSGKTLANINSEISMALGKSLGGHLDRANETAFLIGHYDTRRLDWPKILPLRISPQRFYTRPNLNCEEVLAIRNLFKRYGVVAPVIGFLDRTRQDNFSKYN